MSSFADDPGAVLDRLSDPVVVVDDRMVITSANQATANLIGAGTPGDLIGRVGTEWVHEPDRVDAAERLATLADGEDRSPVSLRLVRFDQSVVWVEVTGAIVSAPPEPARVALSLRNVDWRHAADLDAARVVQRSHSLVSAALLLQALPPGGLSEALETVVESVASAVRAEVIAVHEVVRDGGAMALRARWVTSRAAESTRNLPVRTVALDQVPNWVNALNTTRSAVEVVDDRLAIQSELTHVEPAIIEGLSLALQPGERLLGALTVGTGADRRLSSDERDYLQRAAEIIGVAFQRERSDRTLVESEAMFRDLFENSSAIMYLVDPESLRIVDANEAAARFYGHERRDMTGMDLHELTVHSRAELAEMVGAARTGGSTTIIDEQQRLADGDVRTVEIHSTPMNLGSRRLDLAIVQDVTDQRRAVARLERLASTDDLTGALNRRRFLEVVTEEIERSSRYRHHLTLLVLDLDHFKSINDEWGHLAGDAVLVEFARICSGFLRSSDRFARMGGEEFALLLPETGLEEAAVIAERIRVATEAIVVAEVECAPVCTVSIGAAQWREGWDEDDLFAEADRKLYRAKQAGRNRSEV